MQQMLEHTCIINSFTVKENGFILFQEIWKTLVSVYLLRALSNCANIFISFNDPWRFVILLLVVRNWSSHRNAQQYLCVLLYLVSYHTFITTHSLCGAVVAEKQNIDLTEIHNTGGLCPSIIFLNNITVGCRN